MEERIEETFLFGEDLSDTAPQIAIVCRVLKRYVFSKTLLFMDTVYPQDNNHHKLEYCFASIVVKSDNLALLAGIIAGHVIRLTGKVQNYSISLIEEATQRPSILTRSEDIEILEPWNLDELGFFSFEPIHLSPVLPYCKGHPITAQWPLLAVQAKHQTCERLIEVLRNKFAIASQYNIRESSTCNIKSKDRLVIISPSSAEAQRGNFTDIMQQIIRDPILSPYILRVYSGIDDFHTTTVPSIFNASLDIAFEQMIQQIGQFNQTILEEDRSTETKKISKIRLHTFPKYINNRLLDWSVPFEVAWSPTDYDYVLSITLIDGLWLLSLTHKENIFIGDLREKKITPKIRANLKTNAKAESTLLEEDVQESICRAAAKVEECMRRNHWIYQSSESLVFQHYQFAIDIGASPGGWTSFLSQSIDVEIVLSIDKGDLLIPPPRSEKIIYWQIHGEEAIERLKLAREQSSVQEDLKVCRANDLRSRSIDLFCCDANISPYKSIQFLLLCHEYHFLANEGRFIITFKNIFGRKNEWEKAIEECVGTLNRSPFYDLRMIHLLANTPKEVTVTGYFKYEM